VRNHAERSEELQALLEEILKDEKKLKNLRADLP
jgi:hypothetical protein